MITTTKIRYATLALGLVMAAFLTANLLSGSSTSTEFWTELFTGSGLAFLFYSFPYILFVLLTRKVVSRRKFGVGAIIILFLSLVSVTEAVIAKGTLRPEDISIIDLNAYLNILQVCVAVWLAGVPKNSGQPSHR